MQNTKKPTSRGEVTNSSCDTLKTILSNGCIDFEKK